MKDPLQSPVPSVEVGIERVFSGGRDVLGLRKQSMSAETMQWLMLDEKKVLYISILCFKLSLLVATLQCATFLCSTVMDSVDAGCLKCLRAWYKNLSIIGSDGDMTEHDFIVLSPCPLTLTHLYKYRKLLDGFAAIGMMRMSTVE
jgi:hypothetical protein